MLERKALISITCKTFGLDHKEAITIKRCHHKPFHFTILPTHLDIVPRMFVITDETRQNHLPKMSENCL
jgi:hypothetical protein